MGLFSWFKKNEEEPCGCSSCGPEKKAVKKAPKKAKKKKR